tara:strand:- start:83 stop:235 length:153 start_codon:yes stop_codon:yes gene_type:complete
MEKLIIQNVLNLLSSFLLQFQYAKKELIAQKKAARAINRIRVSNMTPGTS